MPCMSKTPASARVGDLDAIRPTESASAARPPPASSRARMIGTTAIAASGGLHLSRRIQHAGTGLVILAISHIVPPYPVGLGLLSIATLAFHMLHSRRVHDEAWDAWYLERFGSLLREHERGEWEEEGGGGTAASAASSSGGGARKGRRRRRTVPALPGAFYFLLGATASALLFPAAAARTSLLVLSIADPAAGLAGTFFGEFLHRNVSWERLLYRARRALISRGEGKRTKHGGGRGDDARGASGGCGGGASVAGSVACALATVLCTYAYIPPPARYIGIVPRDPSAVAGGGAISLSLCSRLGVGILTAATEAVAGRRLPAMGMRLADDNLMIPLVVGGLIYCWAE